MNQFVNMVMRILMRRVINTGINKGVGALSRRGGQESDAEGPQTQRRSTPAAGGSAKHLRRSARMIRRMGRF